MAQHISTDCNGMICVSEQRDPFMHDCEFLTRNDTETNQEFVIRHLKEALKYAPANSMLKLAFSSTPPADTPDGDRGYELTISISVPEGITIDALVEVWLSFADVKLLFAAVEISRRRIGSVTMMTVDTSRTRYA